MTTNNQEQGNTQLDEDFVFLDEANFLYLCEGLTIARKDMNVLDNVLQGLDKANKLPSAIILNNQEFGCYSNLPLGGQQIIVVLDIMLVSGKTLTTATVGGLTDLNLPPGAAYQPAFPIAGHSPKNRNSIALRVKRPSILSRYTYGLSACTSNQ